MSGSLKNKRVLITCGPTWVPIDDMRIISNQSTGALGQRIALDMAHEGAKVTLLEGPVMRRLESSVIKIQPFIFYDEFLKLMTQELKKKYDVVIHAAAVSDYKVKSPSKVKISSHLKNLSIELTPTKKIIHLIKCLNSKVFLVGFKLESKMTKTLAMEKTVHLFKKAKCDLVIANSSTPKKYKAYILDHQNNFLAEEVNREGLSKALIKNLKGIL